MTPSGANSSSKKPRPIVLTEYIRRRREHHDILLMTHIVLGYPKFDDSLRMIEAMVENGVDLMELQIPFSEPMADGPVILRANQAALMSGSTVDRCLAMSEAVARRFDIPFVFMTYFNVVYARGGRQFAEQARAAGIRGAIIPDLPHEEGDDLLAHMREIGVDPILLFSPTTSDARMRAIAQRASGFVYCVARKGVTGAATDFEALDTYLARCRAATDLPLALGFGVKDRRDVAEIIGKVDVAVVGSQTIRVLDERGVGAVGAFVASLRG
ncbi:MAG: tryptophan synthase subunit alpha [Myxococcales bacterium FL481]|nr:MAG: tryptophan synthase subunit alpha [Myxococcales bacterium FL481]